MNGFWSYCQRKGLCPVCVQGKCLCDGKAIDKTDADIMRSRGYPEGYNWSPESHDYHSTEAGMRGTPHSTGDLATVNAHGHPRHGQTGRVSYLGVRPDAGMIYVRFPDGVQEVIEHEHLVPANETSNTISPSHPTGHEHESYFAQKPAGKAISKTRLDQRLDVGIVPHLLEAGDVLEAPNGEHVTITHHQGTQHGFVRGRYPDNEEAEFHHSELIPLGDAGQVRRSVPKVPTQEELRGT